MATTVNGGQEPPISGAEAREFLKTLHGDHAPGWVNLWTLEGEASYWVAASQTASVANLVERLAPRCNIYTGVGLRRARLGKRRGEGKDVSAIPGAWADVDVRGPAHKKDALPESFEAAEALLRDGPAAPSLIVHSGHGLQAYWLFDEPWVFANEDERRAAQALLRRVEDDLKRRAKARGWSLDTTSDLARVLRVPGTVNRKPNCDPAVVRVILRNGPRYDRAELAALFPASETTGDTRANGARRNGRRSTGRPSPEELLERALQRVRAGEGRNDVGLWLACQLRDNGQDEAEAERVVLEFQARVADDGDHAYTEQEARASVRSAFTRSAREPWGTRPHRSDLGNAERYIEAHRDDLRNCPELGGPFIWNGRHWEPGREADLMDRAATTVRAIYCEAADIADHDTRQKLVGHALKSEQAERLRAMVRLATSNPQIDVRPEVFDQRPNLVNFANGTVDLATGELYPHDRTDYLTRAIPYPYLPDAQAPTWDRFLERVQPNDGARAYVRRALGYSLWGLTTEQVFFWLYGCGVKPDGTLGDGCNGKSTLLETALRLFGGYGRKVDIAVFREAREGTEKPRPEVFRLRGQRLVVGSELPAGFILNEPLIKDITGGETISARDLYGKPISFVPELSLWCYGNFKPVIPRMNEGIRRRLKLILFPTYIAPEERDRDLLAKLLAEAPGILAQFVSEAVAWRREGLPEPAFITKATEDYFAEQDKTRDFRDDWLIFEPGAYVGADELAREFETWRKACPGASLATYDDLTHYLKLHGCESTRLFLDAEGRRAEAKQGARRRVWLGVRLRGLDDEA
jgi:putative DNA primase/helicase